MVRKTRKKKKQTTRLFSLPLCVCVCVCLSLCMYVCATVLHRNDFSALAIKGREGNAKRQERHTQTTEESSSPCFLSFFLFFATHTHTHNHIHTHIYIHARSHTCMCPSLSLSLSPLSFNPLRHFFCFSLSIPSPFRAPLFVGLIPSLSPNHGQAQ